MSKATDVEIRKLNMLRGLAALIVVVAHFSNGTGWPSAALGEGSGQFGVMLFFLLSGFLMAYLYMGQEYSRANIRRYAVARTARVMPLFLLVVLLSYLLQKCGVTRVLYPIPNVQHLLSHLLLIKGTSVLWTIGPEIQFYLIFAVMWRFAASREASLYLVVAATLALLFFMDFPQPRGKIGGLPYDLHLFHGLPYFFMGVVLGRLYTSFRVPQYLQSTWFVLVLLLIPLMYPKIFLFLTGTSHRMWSDLGVLFIMSMVFFSVLFLVPDDNVLMSNPVGDFLGKISYSLYLLHLPVFRQTKAWDFANPGLHFAVFIFCSLLVAYISYRLIELPSSRFIRGFAVTQSNRPGAPSGWISR